MIETVPRFTHFPTTSAERFKALTELVLADERGTGAAGIEVSDGSALGKRNMVTTFPLNDPPLRSVLFTLFPPGCPSGVVYGHSIPNVM